MCLFNLELSIKVMTLEREGLDIKQNKCIFKDKRTFRLFTI